jgi:hypothetical protein
MAENPVSHPRPRRAEDPRVLVQIQDALRGMEHGKLTVVVQDGLIIQLERTDKVRLPRPDRP